MQISSNHPYPLFFSFEKRSRAREEVRNLRITVRAHPTPVLLYITGTSRVHISCLYKHTAARKVWGGVSLRPVSEAKNTLSSPCTPITRNSSCVASSELTDLFYIGDYATSFTSWQHG